MAIVFKIASLTALPKLSVKAEECSPARPPLPLSFPRPFPRPSFGGFGRWRGRRSVVDEIVDASEKGFVEDCQPVCLLEVGQQELNRDGVVVGVQPVFVNMDLDECKSGMEIEGEKFILIGPAGVADGGGSDSTTK